MRLPHGLPAGTPVSNPTNAFETMDVLRGLVAVTVAASHVRDVLLHDYAGQRGTARLFYFVTGFGHAGVVMFFVLSGFWITKTVVRRATLPSFWRVYLVDRLSRLWVVLLPALIIGGILDFVGSRILNAPLYNGTSGAESLAWHITLAPSAFLANAAFLQNLSAPIFGSNGPLWSLAYEFWYYLWFPALWLGLRYRRPSFALLTLGMGIAFPPLTFGFASWMCGSILFGVTRRLPFKIGNRWVAIVILVVSAIPFCLSMVGIRSHPSYWMDILVAMAFAVWLFAIYITDVKPKGLAKVAKFGAKASFSLYAIHYPIAALAAAILSPDGRMAYSSNGMVLVAIVLAVCILAAMAFAKATEAHTPSIRRRLGYSSALAPVA